MRALIPILSLAVGSVGLLQGISPQQPLSDKIVFEFNENFPSYSAQALRSMTFGYSRVAGALLWLRFLQHTPPKKIGKNQVSWIYRDLDALTEIDPGFYPAYELGGAFLSVVTEDKRGAELLLLKGTKAFPERWRIRSNLAYHYQFELNEPRKAFEQNLAGSKLPGAPFLLGVLASSFINKTEGPEQSIHFLEGMIRDAQDPFVRGKFLAKLNKLKEEKKR